MREEVLFESEFIGSANPFIVEFVEQVAGGCGTKNTALICWWGNGDAGMGNYFLVCTRVHACECDPFFEKS